MSYQYPFDNDTQNSAAAFALASYRYQGYRNALLKLSIGQFTGTLFAHLVRYDGPVRYELRMR